MRYALPASKLYLYGDRLWTVDAVAKLIASLPEGNTTANAENPVGENAPGQIAGAKCETVIWTADRLGLSHRRRRSDRTVRARVALSREIEKLDQLKRSLAVYRLALASHVRTTWRRTSLDFRKSKGSGGLELVVDLTPR